MAYELYQSRHKGYEIDNLLDDVVDLNADVAALKTEYDANKVKMSDGTILPLHLVNTYATKTDLSAKADSTQVAADIATATADMATQTQVASDIATATTDMATNASVASAIAAAAYTLPEATTTTLGGVKPDGTTITVDSDGTIHSAGSGTGGGHTILNTDGTAVAQENKLQFKGLSVTDDSTNGVTKVEGVGLSRDSLDDIAATVPSVPAIIIGDAFNYSTKEKRVGTWIDNKPLYQKTLVGTTPSSSGDVATGLTNIGVIFIVSGFIPDGLGTNGYTVSYGYFGSENDYCFVDLKQDGSTLYFSVKNSRFLNRPFYITVQYTKTTD